MPIFLHSRFDRGDRERERERERDRDRSRERERETEIRRIPSPPIISKKEESSSSSEEEIDKEEEQRRLELEMTKRRERIERWRAERKIKELEANKKDIKALLPAQIAAASAKKWSLEDESEEEDNAVMTIDLRKEPDSPESKFHSIKKSKFDDDDDDGKLSKLSSSAKKAKSSIKIKKMEVEEENQAEKEEQKPAESEKPAEEAVEATAIEDDIDPLDAFMQEVDKEVRKVSHFDTQTKDKQQGVVILTGVSKKNKKVINKGELIEQNMDSLEYSSEEDIEDMKDTAANLANKHRKELAKIDHSGMNYAPFRKDFYVEVPELGRMTQQDVEKYRTELEGIQVKGKGCPKPIKVSKS